MFAQNNVSYVIGILVSLVLHLLIAVFTILILEHQAATAAHAPEIFSVTLEGGEKLGGFTQVPKEGSAKTPKASDQPPTEPPPPAEEAPEPEEPSAPEETAAKEETPSEPEEPVEETKPLEQPSAIKDPEIEKKKEAERKAKEDAEKKRKADEEKKKKAEEEKKKAEEEKKKKAEDEKRKAEDEKKKKEEEKKRKEEEAKKKAEDDRRKAELERKQREKRLQETIAKYRQKSEYEGESANAGGEGFGAARVGGTGMGGGTLASAEKIAYANQLQQHVKSGWRWLPGSKKLRTLVTVRIQPNGQVQDIRVTTSSGNEQFDESVVRAIRKASPVPAPPAKFYDEFKSVRFWFDSHEQ